MNKDSVHSRIVETLREEIDRIDDQLLELLNQRAKIAVEVGRLKIAAEPQGHEMRVASREEFILNRLKMRDEGIFPHESVELIFREIFKTCLSLQK